MENESEEGGVVQDAALISRARDFIEEYKKYGFYRNLSRSEEEEAIARIVEYAKEDEEWPLDWWVMNADERNAYWFDTEWMGDLQHMYSEFLAGLSKITGGDLKFENFNEFVDLERHEGPSWVEFDWMGRRHYIDAKGYGDYIDYVSLVIYLNAQLGAMGNPKRFVHPFPSEDQTANLSYLTMDELNRLQTEKNWPTDVDNSYLLTPAKAKPETPPTEKRFRSLRSLFKKK